MKNNNWYNPSKQIYHLSTTKGLKLLTPQVPHCAILANEEMITSRICFSDSIKMCLSALQQSWIKMYYVYVPYKKQNECSVYIPSIDEVKDCNIHHEIWLLKETKVKCIGIIEQDPLPTITHHYSGRGRVSFFHYNYSWKIQYEEENNHGTND